jgi:acyl-CoA thioesterase-1
MPTKSLFFGDSNTLGEGLLDPHIDRWTARVARAGGHVELNEGKGGRPSSALEDFCSVLETWKNDTEVSCLAIALGGNDARDAAPDVGEKVARNVGLMIDLARRDAPTWEIVLCGPCNISRDHLEKKDIADLREKNLLMIRAALRALSGIKGCLFVDFLGIVPTSSLTADGVHPDAAGHMALACHFLASFPSKSSLKR